MPSMHRFYDDLMRRIRRRMPKENPHEDSAAARKPPLEQPHKPNKTDLN